MASMDLKNAVLTIEDGTSPTPNSITVVMGEGNLTWSEKKPRIYDKDRGRLDTVRNADEEPMEVQFAARWEYIKADTGDDATIEDALKQRGEASDWVSSSADTCEPYAVNLKFTFTPICSGDKEEIFLFPDFRYETLDHDAQAATISISGMCNAVEPTITREEQA